MTGYRYRIYYRYTKTCNIICLSMIGYRYRYQHRIYGIQKITVHSEQNFYQWSTNKYKSPQTILA